MGGGSRDRNGVEWSLFRYSQAAIAGQNADIGQPQTGQRFLPPRRANSG